MSASSVTAAVCPENMQSPHVVVCPKISSSPSHHTLPVAVLTQSGLGCGTDVMATEKPRKKKMTASISSQRRKIMAATAGRAHGQMGANRSAVAPTIPYSR